MAEQVKLLPSDAALRVAIRSAMGSQHAMYEDALVMAIGDVSPSMVKPDMVPRAQLELVQFKLDAMYKVVQAYENLGK